MRIHQLHHSNHWRRWKDRLLKLQRGLRTTSTKCSTIPMTSSYSNYSHPPSPTFQCIMLVSVQKKWLAKTIQGVNTYVGYCLYKRENLLLDIVLGYSGIEIWNELREWLVAHANTAPESLCEQLLYPNVPTFFPRAWVVVYAKLIYMSYACTRTTAHVKFQSLVIPVQCSLLLGGHEIKTAVYQRYSLFCSLHIKGYITSQKINLFSKFWSSEHVEKGCKV